MISIQPDNDIELKAVWDDFLMCKVLPRIEGDIDKLSTSPTELSILQVLEQLLQHEFSEFWLEGNDSANARPDFYRSRINTDDAILIECRSKRKIQWMQERLKKSGFTSFWP